MKRLLPLLDDAVEDALVTDRTKHYAEKLTIGLPPSVNRALLSVAQPILDTKAAYPFLTFDIIELKADGMAQALLNGQVDAVLTLEHPGEELDQLGQIDSRTIATRKIYIGLSRFRMELDGLDTSTPVRTLLERYPLNIQATNSGMVQQAYSIYRHFGLPPYVQYSESQMKMLLSARIGDGLLLAPEFQVLEDDNQRYLQYFDAGIDRLCLEERLYLDKGQRFRTARLFLWPADRPGRAGDETASCRRRAEGK